MRTVLLAAQSLDGFITRHDTPGTAFTSDADKSHFRNALDAFDCSVIGGETYRVARNFIRGRLASARLRIVLTRAPEAYAADVVPGQLEFTSDEPAALLAALAARGRAHCAILGGAQIHSLFLTGSLVDELWLTVEPVLFGAGTPFLARRDHIQLALLDTEKLSESTLLLKYRVQRSLDAAPPPHQTR